MAAESSPRDLSFKRSAAAAHLNQHPEDDEDEFVDPDGSDHERDSPIGKADLMLSDDESDICKFTRRPASLHANNLLAECAPRSLRINR